LWQFYFSQHTNTGMDLEDEEADYLNSVIVGYDANKVIRTSYVDEVKDMLTRKRFISIEGPKGCGKTYMCTSIL